MKKTRRKDSIETKQESARLNEELAMLKEDVATLKHKLALKCCRLLDINYALANLLDQHLPDWRERVTFPSISE
jgi:hypothetical protein